MEDEVDRILRAWSNERPDLDVTPLEVLSRVARLARHVDAARRAALAREGLESFEFDVLTALRRAGGTLGAGRLAGETLVSSGTMTHRVDILEGRGLAARLIDSEDGRAVLVTLTDLGREAVDRSMLALLGREAAILGTLSQAERTRLAALLRNVLLGFESGAG
jgi:DNA-binding MarR family transcriptional regulator